MIRTNKTMRLTSVIVSVGLGLVCSTVFSEAEPALCIYLPRQVQVADEEVTLGAVAVVRGSADAVNSAEAVSLGRFVMPSQQMVISRAMISGRLAGSGFDASAVAFTGADKVTVTQNIQIVRGEKIAEAAESFARKNQQDKTVCGYEAVGQSADFTVPVRAQKIELVPSAVAAAAQDRTKVSVAIVADGKEVGRREIEFRLKYFRREAVALRQIAPGEIITRDNVEISEKVSSDAEPVDWQVPFGLAAVRRIPAGSTITPGMVGPVRREIVVRRNRHVAVIFERPGLSITAVGRAMEDGRVGECIKVRMQIKDSPRIIYAKVKDNGTVEPLM
jgi:flagella basal body P-ring formation protein FlgA